MSNELINILAKQLGTTAEFVRNNYGDCYEQLLLYEKVVDWISLIAFLVISFTLITIYRKVSNTIKNIGWLFDNPIRLVLFAGTILWFIFGITDSIFAINDLIQIYTAPDIFCLNNFTELIQTE